MDHAAGGKVTSADGLFEVYFPPNAVSFPAEVTISQTQPNAQQSFGTAYTVTISPDRPNTNIQVSTATTLTFRLRQSGFNAPINECFIVTASPPALAVAAWEAEVLATSSSPSNGPQPTDPPTLRNFGDCYTSQCMQPKDDVCDPCMRACCSKSNGNPSSPNQPLSPACFCEQGDGGAAECMRGCVSGGSRGACK